MRSIEEGQTTTANISPSTSSSVTTPTPTPTNIRSSVRSASGRQGHSRRHSSGHQRSRQHQHQEQRAYQHHFNNLDSGMPVNIWGIDRREVWRTCFCFHVRTVTIFIGVCHLMMYILYLSFLAAMFMYDAGDSLGPSGHGGRVRIREDQMLPTPVSVSNTNNFEALQGSLDQEPNPKTRLDPLNMVMDRKANSQVVLLTACNMLITLLMVYGAVRGKPSYLMPFFVLRVFDFCIFCLTMVGYFSYLPNVTETISHSHWIPNKDALLEMDPQLLSLFALITIVLLIAAKAYIIGVVWNCYKYLMLRNSVIRTVIAFRPDDPTNPMNLHQNLLPDLPDYETAMNDPRYAKKPPMDPHNANNNSTPGGVVATIGGASTTNCPTAIAVPPPPYSVAVATEPLTYNFVIPTATTITETEETTVRQNSHANEEPSSSSRASTIVEITETETSNEAPPTVTTTPVPTVIQVTSSKPTEENTN